MNHGTKMDIEPHNQNRLATISTMLREIRLGTGRNQDGFDDFSLSRRQIQRGEGNSNLTLLKLFQLLDCYDYTLSQFFEGME